ncbi:MAG TPA: SRPBCC domain-containing protein [Gammaproteobacteria bacterium]|nr:SRPBCC domain-containing protein [Gammaproteobacteria bacterium]
MHAKRNNPAVERQERELLIARVFDAPRALVFKAWTERDHILHWLAPRGFTVTFAEGDVRPGGRWRSGIRKPDGTELWVGGVYHEVIENERLVFTHAWDNPDGKRGHETLVTVSFAEQNGKTRLTFHQAPFESVANRDGHRGGWGECFDILAEYLAEISKCGAKK